MVVSWWIVAFLRRVYMRICNLQLPEMLHDANTPIPLQQECVKNILRT